MLMYITHISKLNMFRNNRISNEENTSSKSNIDNVSSKKVKEIRYFVQTQKSSHHCLCLLHLQLANPPSELRLPKQASVAHKVLRVLLQVMEFHPTALKPVQL